MPCSTNNGRKHTLGGVGIGEWQILVLPAVETVALKMRLMNIALTQVRFGYRRLTILISEFDCSFDYRKRCFHWNQRQ